MEDFRDVCAGKRRDLRAAVGGDGDEALGFQQPQRVAHRDAAHGKACGEVFLPQQRAGPARARQDVGAERSCDGFRCSALAVSLREH